MHFHLQLLFPEVHETQEARFSDAVVVWHYQWIPAAELAYPPTGEGPQCSHEGTLPRGSNMADAPLCCTDP